MRQEVYEKYELLEDRQVTDLGSHELYFRHKKSGARVLVLKNDDENKVFCIGFRTPVSDSTGVPHILEHSVLCGSDHFPVKDPFVELVKGSLNTFLNAMTYPDKTVYPAASCNDADFRNIMHVYMDAVFFPNIYKHEEIFRQEGWHYELENPDGELTVNGVVYNEMKGAFSSAEGVLDRVILNSLFPDNGYAYESGGDPEVIPTLTYEQFLDFHRRYYHPSNSYIYLYGDMDTEERLLWMDREYLSRFDRITVDSAIQIQKPFTRMIRVERRYSIAQGEEERDNTFLSYNKVIGTSLDPKLYLAFQVLEYVLLSASGAPLKQALLDAGIGQDIMSSYDNGICQPIFSVIAKKANPEDEERFVQVIEKELARIAEEGIDRKALQAGINYYEFKYREADFGSYPKGLMYGLQAFDSWLYDDQAPMMHLEALDVFRFLKEQLDTDYYRQLVRIWLLENPHGSLVMIRPDRGLTARMDAEQREKLAAYKRSLSEQELLSLVEGTKKLREYQETPDTREALASIPILAISDIRKDAERLPLEQRDSGNRGFLFSRLSTNGIGYVQMDFDIGKIPKEQIPYLGILSHVLGYVGTQNYSYQELFHEINIETGGISSCISTYGNVQNCHTYTAAYTVRAKALYDQMPKVFALVEEMLLTSHLDDEKRLKEILSKLKSRLQAGLVSAGHSTASLRAMSYFSESAEFSELTGGIAFYHLVEELDSRFDEKKKELTEILKELVEHLFQPENLLLHYTAEESGLSALERQLPEFRKHLFNLPVRTEKTVLTPCKKNEGFQTASKVQYVASAGNFRDAGYSYSGVLRILKVILSYDYLWNNIRVKGGAYGCMSGFSRTGDSYFVTYRDPHLRRSREVFEKIPEYLGAFDVDEISMRKYIIGAISELDTPLTPSVKGYRALAMERSGITFDDQQRERDEILCATAADVRAQKPVIQAILDADNFCVIGNEEKILKEKELFMETKNLIHA